MPVTYRGHVDEFLSGLSVRFAQDQSVFIADQVFPTYGVQKQSGEFLVYPQGWFLRNQVRERPLHGEPAQATYGLSSSTYAVKEYALAAVLDDRETANATPPFDPEANHVRFLTENHLINRELLWADAHMKTGVWGVDLTGQAGAPSATAQATPGSTNLIQQWDQATSKPQRAVNQIKTYMALKTGREANVGVFGRELWTVLLDHPDIIERVKYAEGSPVLSQQLIANYLGLDNIYVPAATHNVAPELAPQLGDNKTLNFVVNSKAALFLYRNTQVGPMMMTAGLSLVWRGLLNGGGFTFPVYRERIDRSWSDWFAVRSAFTFKVVAPEAGVYVNSLIA